MRPLPLGVGGLGGLGKSGCVFQLLGTFSVLFCQHFFWCQGVFRLLGSSGSRGCGTAVLHGHPPGVPALPVDRRQQTPSVPQLQMQGGEGEGFCCACLYNWGII